MAHMDIREATRSYEAWMGSCAPVVEKHLRNKHAKMEEDPFQFFRGTYYRWAQLWCEVCSEFQDAPIVLSVGDLHVDSFGTWRDAEGRLCWGVDDFDEAWPLPYTNDLIRLVTSARIAKKVGLLKLKTRTVCEVALEAYRYTLRNHGCPIVLAEEEQHLERLGIAALKAPKGFWEKLNAHPSLNDNVPADARGCFRKILPDGVRFRVIRREAGLGSLGQQRFVALAECDGGFIAREIKRVLPSASLWLSGQTGHKQTYYETIMERAVRSRDPFQKISKCWIVRRLSPDSNPIHLEELNGERDEETLLYAMGTETANVHLGQPRARRMILADLKRRDRRWLRNAVKRMAKTIVADWKEFRR
jgi:hypothetical protein